MHPEQLIRSIREIDPFNLLWIGGALRVALIVYGLWQDANLEVPYTDIDYIVFSDAAAFMYEGKSPYLRDTYRYSPLLALLLVPNVWLHPCWGKFLFSAADLLVGYLVLKLLRLQGVSKDRFSLYLATWLFNPYTCTIGTRGNCEALVCAMVLWFLICFKAGRFLQAAIWYGLAVHFRLYPIIYVLPILLILSGENTEGKKSFGVATVGLQSTENLGPVSNFPSIQQLRNHSQNNSMCHQKCRKPFFAHCFYPAHLLNRYTIQFGLASGGFFFLLTGVCYYLYDGEFLHEALLYHVTRTDPRHNFSIYFYYIYLHQDQAFSIMERLLAFVPQMFLQIVLAVYFSKDLPFCFFLQTIGFVAFNKVITAQYFVWFFCLLPLVLPSVSLKFKWKGALCVGIWCGAQLHWLAWAYLLEFRGENVLFQLWLASILFFAANICTMSIFIFSHSNDTKLCIASSLVTDDIKKNK